MIGLRVRALLAVTVASILYFAVDRTAGMIALFVIAGAVEYELRGHMLE